MGFIDSIRIVGSSPRVRGKPGGWRTPALPPRLIPARAGKTNQLVMSFYIPEAHPRACGENRTRGVWDPGFQGSSPRVRGKLQSLDRLVLAAGLIPARAGKTWRGRGAGGRPGAHPRACGENLIRQPEAGRPRGSSPRVRGKHRRCNSSKQDRGLIPARAGKTSSRGSSSRSIGAHPRACGENYTLCTFYTVQTGSSPRVRGKPENPREALELYRLIPARAGKTRLNHH